MAAPGVEVGWLEDTGGKEFRVGAEHDHGAGLLRIDRPIDRIHRLLQAGQVSRAIELFGAAHISECIAAYNFERRIIDPFIGIADDDLQRGQFRRGFQFRIGRHPSELRNSFAVSGEQIANHGLRFCFSLRWEILSRVQLADGQTERAVGGGDGIGLAIGFCSAATR
jgi:hypothetical protein